MNCSDERLRTLLAADEDSHDYAAALKHVDHCEFCQTRIEQIAAHESVWQESQSILTSSEALHSVRSERSADAKIDSPWHRMRWQPRPSAWTESMAKQLLAPPSHPEMLGRIGRYEVERLIGSGGSGIVFKAFDTELNRPVAIKIQAPHLAGNGSARQRFAREARAAAAIVHEHVVAIHNVETECAAPFLVMQYVAGESLQQRIDRVGSLELREILRIAMQTASGLAAAHAQGLVHRDVKPGNIMLEQGIERTLLTDFGLARAVDDASLTHTGYHPGTPQYMSPEQARGDSVDARSDLFSLGSVIYTMCTGRAPFRAETSFGVLRRITDNEPRSMREICPDVPVWLEDIVAKLHAKLPENRFSNAEEVRLLIEQCLGHVQHPTGVALPESCQARERADNAKPRDAISKFRVAMVILVTCSLLTLAFAGRHLYFRSASTLYEPSTLSSNPTQNVTIESPESITHAWDPNTERITQFDLELQSLELRSKQLWRESESVPKEK
jgi:eukaryotic-like serine/threonine-protein kinase